MSESLSNVEKRMLRNEGRRLMRLFQAGPGKFGPREARWLAQLMIPPIRAALEGFGAEWRRSEYAKVLRRLRRGRTTSASR